MYLIVFYGVYISIWFTSVAAGIILNETIHLDTHSDGSLITTQFLLHEEDHTDDIIRQFCWEHQVLVPACQTLHSSIHSRVSGHKKGTQQHHMPVVSAIELAEVKLNIGDMIGYKLLQHYGMQKSVAVRRIGLSAVSYQRDTYRSVFCGDFEVHNAVGIVGSILQWIETVELDSSGLNITVIGLGYIEASNEMSSCGHITYKGVRGPLTQDIVRSRCGQVPAIISDPGLLISRLFVLPTVRHQHQRDVGFVIHESDREKFFSLFPHYREYLIDNHNGDMQLFVQQMSMYKRVVSSSLHGIVFSHAYSIPVCAIKVDSRIIGGEFKYRDYYHSIGYTQYTRRLSLEEIGDFSLSGFSAIVDNCWQPDRIKIERVKSMQESMIMDYFENYHDAY